ncbi:uncharacterized protein LOC120076105 [Benincasa hispida]|uniref:uncharacterized protein LOC120076105 n=1 Tax=Benincasa hispida TaxID=102211 RepID=UPI00190134EF|nr:uncharacterized protein LOC120076105 [Benincasa hispida]
MWEIVENGFQEVEARADQAQRDALKETRKKDKNALYILYQLVDEDTFETIANAEMSKATWDKLQSTHRGADRVKKVRLKTLRGEFKSLQMKETEVIAKYHTKVMAFINQLRRNGEEITDVRVMEKVLQSLNTKFEIIATTIEETQDLENMTIEQFIGSLQAYEEKKKRRMKQTEIVEQLLQLKIKEENIRGRGRGRGGRGHGGKGEANTDVSQNSSESSRGRGGRGRGRRGRRSGRDKSQEKSEVFEIFKRFKARVENESNLTIKAMRTDRDGSLLRLEIQEEEYDFLPYFEEDDENELTRDEMGEGLPILVPPHSADRSSSESSSSNSKNEIGPRGTRSLRELDEVYVEQPLGYEVKGEEDKVL